MNDAYHHTQAGYLTVIVLGAFAIFALAISLKDIHNSIPWFVLGVLMVCLILFSSLTIDIRKERLIWSFGPGVIRKSIPINEITGVCRVKNSWWYGWGIRLTPHGWLYNVSGFHAVEFRTKEGKKFRLGTDQPDELAQIVNELIKQSSPSPNS